MRNASILRLVESGWSRNAAVLGVLNLALLLPLWASTHDGKPLQVYLVDVEGGQATLFVTPSGQSLLIDTGWPGNDDRDADRIVAAAKDASVTKVDFVLLTHFHKDHAGGISQLAAKIPVGAVIDHGENREHSDSPTEQVWQDYLSFLAKGKGFFELVNYDALGLTYPQHAVTALRPTIAKNPQLVERVLKTLIESVAIFKGNKEKSFAVWRKYMRGASEEFLEETYQHTSAGLEAVSIPSLQVIASAPPAFA